MVQQLSPSPSVIYPLAQDTAETRRLIRQSGFYNPFTRSLFAEAGLGPGMRVLDIGSGAGDVALLAAERVGPTGAVVGIDRNPEVLAVARERAAVAGFTHLTFQVGDLESIPLEEPFDAIVGRLVLMYQPDPAATLRRLARSLRPAGIVAFQDFNLTAESLRTYPETPLWQRVFTWLREAFVRAGAETRMGRQTLRGISRRGLAKALPAPRLTAGRWPRLGGLRAGGRGGAQHAALATAVRDRDGRGGADRDAGGTAARGDRRRQRRRQVAGTRERLGKDRLH